MTVLDIFAGPGGFDEALRMLGVPDVIGIELDTDACATAEAAGHKRIQADVSMLDLRDFSGVIGAVGSPPCPSFSAAGKGLGKLDMPRILAHIQRIREAGRWLHYSREGWHDPRSALVLEPLRYILHHLPDWVALEQVPGVLPIWQAYCDVLRDHGYHADTALLTAEQYGIVSPCAMHSPTEPVPNAAGDSLSVIGQGSVRASATTPYDSEWTRHARAAVADWVAGAGRDAASVATWLGLGRQEATGDGSVHLTPAGSEAAEWTNAATSMFGLTASTAESIASSWSRWLADRSLGEKWCTTSTDRRTTTIRAILSCIAATLITGYSIGQATRAADCGLCLDMAVPQTRKRAILAARRCIDPWCATAPAGCIRSRNLLPAPTHRKYRKGVARTDGDPTLLPWVSMADALGTHLEGDWLLRSNYGTGGDPANRGTRTLDEPAPTVTGKVGRNKWITRHAPPRAVTLREAAVFQAFRPDYPWQGHLTARSTQIGDAIPPLLAHAVLSNLIPDDHRSTP